VPNAIELRQTAVLALPLVQVSAKVRTGPPGDDRRICSWATGRECGRSARCAARRSRRRISRRGSSCPHTCAADEVRAVVQRAAWARVSVAGEVVGSLDEPGLVVLLGITHGDGDAEALAMASKLANLRILRDAEGRMNRSVSKWEEGCS